MLIRPVTQADARDLRRHCFAATSLDEIHDMIERFEAPPDSHLLVAETENGEAGGYRDEGEIWDEVRLYLQL